MSFKPPSWLGLKKPRRCSMRVLLRVKSGAGPSFMRAFLFVNSWMMTPPSKAGNPPPAVPIVVGNLGGGALVQEPMEKKHHGRTSPNLQTAVRNLNVLRRKHGPGPAGVARNNRLILATIVFVVSLFFNWGWEHWVALFFWYDGHYYGDYYYPGWLEVDLFLSS